MGWAARRLAGAFYRTGGAAVFILILPAGCCYTAGAVVYGRQAAQPVPGLVRLPRDLPRLHDRRLRLPLHRDLAGHYARLAEPRLALSTRAHCSRSSAHVPGSTVRRVGPQITAEVTGNRQTKPRQTYAVGRPLEQRPVGQQREARSGPARRPGSPNRPGLGGGPHGPGRPGPASSLARRSPPAPADATAGRLIASASSQPANRGAWPASAPALAAARSARSAYSRLPGQLGQQRAARAPPR